MSPVFIHAKIIGSFRYWEYQCNIYMLSKNTFIIGMLVFACLFAFQARHPQILQITWAHWYSNHLILCRNNSKGPDEVLAWRSFFHSSNLFISSALSATVGDFYGYSHNMAPLPVIFSTVEQCSHGREVIFRIEIQAHVISRHINH